MGEATLQILVYSLVAAASPVVLAATLTVLGSGHGPKNGIALAAGFLLGQGGVCLVALLIGSSVPDARGQHNAVLGALELALGVALLAAAWHERPGRPERPPTSTSRTVALREKLSLGTKLSHLTPRMALVGGAAVGIGAKRLAITLLAMAEIKLAPLTPSEEIVLAVLFVALAGLLVWIPVGVYLVSGPRADSMVETAKAWLVANERAVACYTSLATGVLLVGVAIARIA